MTTGPAYSARIFAIWSVPLLCAALISSIRVHPFESFFGDRMQVGTLASIVLLCTALFVPGLFRKRAARFIAAGSVFIVACLFALPHGSILSPQSRAPLLTNLIVLGASYQPVSNVLIGAGPHAFSDAWNLYRPESLNVTELWQEAPSSAYSTVLVFAMEYGLLGLIALLIIPGALIARFSRSGLASRAQIALFSSALLSFAAMFLYPLSLPFVLLAFLLVGCAEAECDPERGRFTLRYPFIPAILVLVALVSVFVGSRQAIAAVHFSQAARAATATSAARQFATATAFWGAQEYLIQAGRNDLLAALAEAESAQNAGLEPDVRAIKRMIDDGGTFLTRAAAADPKNPEAWLAMAAFYGRLHLSGLDGALQQALDAIRRAESLAPLRADVRLNEAVLLNLSGDTVSARTQARAALDLKPDYAAAKDFLAQLEE